MSEKRLEKVIWMDQEQGRRVEDPFTVGPRKNYITLKPKPQVPRDVFNVTVPEGVDCPAGIEIVTLKNGRRRAVIVEEGPDE